MKHMLFIFKYKYHIALALAALFLLSGCKSAELNALEDSASIIQLTTGREISRWHQDKGVTLGKAYYPEVRIEYEPVNNYTVEDIYDEIVATLEKNNWEMEKLGIPEPGFYRASLSEDDFTIKASVKIESDLNIVSLRLRTNS